MPHITTDDGVRLYYEETGSGAPIVFVHEFADDVRGCEPQIRYFSRRYRCVAYNARGYPPSDVPEDPERYSQDRARDDIRAVLDALGIAKAHVVGLSMGGAATCTGWPTPNGRCPGCRRVWLAPSRASASSSTTRRQDRLIERGMVASEAYAIGPSGCSSRIRTRAVGPSLPPISASIRPGRHITMRAGAPALLVGSGRPRNLEVPT